MTHADTCGTNSLLDVFESSQGYGSTAVVRWCSKCGAIVIDVDYDGRTNPGAIMPMRFPDSIHTRK